MRIRFVTQPFSDGTDLRDFFTSVAKDEHLTTVRIVVAWAKRSGLSRISGHLGAVRARGGRTLAVVGVSEGGATEQGLRALIDLVDDAYVYHHPGRTFHPKVYLAEGVDRAVLLVGSQNMTAGGLAWNHEAAVWCDLDLTRDEDRHARDDVVSYVDRLVANEDACVVLDATVLESLLADGTLLVQDEDRPRRRQPVSTPDSPEDLDAVEGEPGAATGAPVFRTSKEHMRSLPALPRPARSRERVETPTAQTGSEAQLGTITLAQLSWSKVLEPTDAQQPPSPRSNATGNLRLSKENFSIDRRTYFRYVFFDDLNWRFSSKNKALEEAWFDAAVVINGEDAGVMRFRTSHLPSRVSNQSNVPTVLHWGGLGRRLRDQDRTGWTVTIERTTGGGTRLSLSP